MAYMVKNVIQFPGNVRKYEPFKNKLIWCGYILKTTILSSFHFRLKTPFVGLVKDVKPQTNKNKRQWRHIIGEDVKQKACCSGELAHGEPVKQRVPFSGLLNFSCLGCAKKKKETAQTWRQKYQEKITFVQKGGGLKLTFNCNTHFDLWSRRMISSLFLSFNNSSIPSCNRTIGSFM